MLVEVLLVLGMIIQEISICDDLLIFMLLICAFSTFVVHVSY